MPNEEFSQFDTPDEINQAHYEYTYNEIAKELAGGCFDDPQTLAEFVKPRFRSVWNRSLTKADREYRQWKETVR